MNEIDTTHALYKDSLEKFITSMGFSIKEISSYEIDHFDTIFLNISTLDAQDHKMLIGKNGDVLRSIQSLFHKSLEARLATHKNTDKNTHKDTGRGVRMHTKLPSVDVDYYQKYQIEALINKARVLAGRVREYKTTLSCGPMNAYERRVVHTALQDFEDIKTQSCGEGKERYVEVSLL